MFSRKMRADIYTEIVSPQETFSWNEDESVTEGRRRAQRTRLFVLIGLATALALLLALQGSAIHFGAVAGQSAELHRRTPGPQASPMTRSAVRSAPTVGLKAVAKPAGRRRRTKPRAKGAKKRGARI